MAVSPVVVVTAAAGTQEQPRSVSSPLKAFASGPTSSNGTPRPAPTPAGGASLPPTLDLAELMNEEEKRKYAKGESVRHSLVSLTHSLSVEREREREKPF
jgi:cyclin-dependent kinase 7